MFCTYSLLITQTSASSKAAKESMKRLKKLEKDLAACERERDSLCRKGAPVPQVLEERLAQLRAEEELIEARDCALRAPARCHIALLSLRSPPPAALALLRPLPSLRCSERRLGLLPRWRTQPNDRSAQRAVCRSEMSSGRAAA